MNIKGLIKKSLILMLTLICILSFCACETDSDKEEVRLIRIHIRANSNLESDQAVKLKVRDSINDYLTTELSGVTDFETAYKMLETRLDKIIEIADSVLKQNGYGYKSGAKLNNEFFPTRSYEGYVVESGYYDALIINLGEAKGDNWWCVIYPPLCYIQPEGSGNFSYKSKIMEMIEKYFG